MEIKVTIFNPPAHEDGVDNIQKELLNILKTYGGAKRIPSPVREGDVLSVIIPMRQEEGARRALSELKGITINGSTITVSAPTTQPSPSSEGTGLAAGFGAGRVSSKTAPPTPPTAAASSVFVNPYNYVRVHQVAESMVRPFLKENSHWQHRFQEGTHSGRVVCEITTETDLFIGAGKKDPEGDKQAQQPAELLPFELNGQRALPPSSLKGMLSSVMEAAANSALRVLDQGDYPYSRRMEFPQEVLYKIGVVVEEQDAEGNPSLSILPLRTKRPASSSTPFPNYTFAAFDPDNPVYLDGYNRNNGNAINLLNNSNLEDFSADPKYYYLDVRDNIVKNKVAYRSHKYFFLGYQLNNNNINSFITEEEFSSFNNNEKQYYKKGLFKILGVGPERNDNMPPTKKHELFLFVDDNKTKIRILEQAIENFNTLADERSETNEEGAQTEELLPYSPKGRQRDIMEGKESLRLKPNDVVYYEDNGQEVTKISFSACWRDFCGNTPVNNHAYGYFAQIDPLLLPPGLKNQGLTAGEEAQLQLTPVCALLGLVEERKGEGAKAGLALAGRLFFSPGILSPEHTEPNEVIDDEKILPILASPKPPCPEFYFHRADCSGGFITKPQLKPDGNFCPNGRKFYWHHHQQINYVNKENDQDKDYLKNFKQMCRVQPIKPETKFLFAIDFFNLTDFELGLLLYAMRPSDTFRHQLGLGKPLGMGRIRIDLLNLLLVDRRRRYGEDELFADVFFHCQDGTRTDRVTKLRQTFEAKNDLFNRSRFCTTAGENWQRTITELRQNFVDTMKQAYGDDFFAQLENLGHLGATQGLEVRYPPNPGDPASRTESFKWFLRNADKERNITGRRATLPPVPGVAGSQAPALPCDPRE